MRLFLRWLKLFFAGDPYPETPATIARAKAAQIADRIRCGVDEDGHPLRRRGLSAIMAASQDNVISIADRRKQLDAAATLPKHHFLGEHR